MKPMIGASSWPKNVTDERYFRANFPDLFGTTSSCQNCQGTIKQKSPTSSKTESDEKRGLAPLFLFLRKNEVEGKGDMSEKLAGVSAFTRSLFGTSFGAGDSNAQCKRLTHSMDERDRASPSEGGCGDYV